MITYGPCQTPTLGFVVDQAEKIKKFVPEAFWKLEADAFDNEHGRRFIFKWCRGRIFDRLVTKALFSNVQELKIATVVEVKRQKATLPRPMGLNTVKLLQVASKAFGISSMDTMHIAEKLYLRGFTTYPRTESTSFSDNFNFEEVIREHVNHPDWGHVAEKMSIHGFNKPKKGLDAGDHPPITPVRAATRDMLSDREWRIYEFISRNFFGCISEDA